MAFNVIVEPVREPITLQQAKDHLNLTHDLDDALIEMIITSARQRVEQEISKSLLTQTVELSLDDFSDEICLYYAPVQSVTSIAYYDSDNVQQTLAANMYDVDLKSMVGRVTRAYNATYPSVYYRPNAVTITYVAGYGDNAQDVPSPILSAVLLLVGHLYENRDQVSPMNMYDLPMGVSYLLSPYQSITY